MNNAVDYGYLVEGLTGDKVTKVTNMSRRIISYMLPELGNVRREFAPDSTKNLTMHELFTLNNSTGGEQLIFEALFIEDNEIKLALGLPTKEEVPEYSWTREEALKVLKSGTKDEILDALDFGPYYIAEWWKKDILDVKDVDRRKFIGELFHMNVDKAEENVKWASEDPNATGYNELLGGSEQGRTRRSSSLGDAPTVEQTRQRRSNRG